MRIALIDTSKFVRMESWGVTIRGIHAALEAQGCAVVIIGTGPEPFGLPMKAMQWLVQKLAGKRLARDREPLVLQALAHRLIDRIKAADVQVILSPSTQPVAWLECPQPIVFWTDAVFGGMIDFYDSFRNLAERSVRNGHAMEQAALNRCSFAVYTSDWAVGQVRKSYQVNPRKLKMLPYGASLTGIAEHSVDEVITARSKDRCVLLFPAMEWERKGGHIAVEAVRWLNENGQRAELRITGRQPPVTLPPFAVYAGRVSRQQLSQEFASAHFVILPTRADCAPNVFNEASAFATPSLASDVGGVSTLVKNGINGQLFPLEANGKIYGQFVKGMMEDRKAYIELARRSYQEFVGRLNWSVIGREIVDVLQQAVDNSHRT